MNHHGGRYIKDPKTGTTRRVDPQSEEHSAYPAAKLEKNKDGEPVHPATMGSGDAATEIDETPSAPPKAVTVKQENN